MRASLVLNETAAVQTLLFHPTLSPPFPMNANYTVHLPRLCSCRSLTSNQPFCIRSQHRRREWAPSPAKAQKPLSPCTLRYPMLKHRRHDDADLHLLLYAQLRSPLVVPTEPKTALINPLRVAIVPFSADPLLASDPYASIIRYSLDGSSPVNASSAIYTVNQTQIGTASFLHAHNGHSVHPLDHECFSRLADDNGTRASLPTSAHVGLGASFRRGRHAVRLRRERRLPI